MCIKMPEIQADSTVEIILANQLGYERLAMADYTLKVSEDASDSLDTLQGISGVKEVIGRRNADMALVLPSERKVEVRALSLPSGGRPAVNDVKVEEGTYFDGTTSTTLLVQKGFAEHHDLEPGDGECWYYR